MKKHWHHIRFVLFNGKEEDDWFGYQIVSGDSLLHYMLAVEVCHPFLETFKRQVTLWRFHRMQLTHFDRINNIAPQHHFKLKLYCTTEFFKEKAMPWFALDPVVESLQNEGLLLDVRAARTDGDSAKDDHDQKWPPQVREWWPYYIHGVSRAWLTAVLSSAEKLGVQCPYSSESEDVWKRMRVYRAIAEDVAEPWKRWAPHAIIHHANAVWGYQWVNVIYSPRQVVLYEGRKPGLYYRIRKWLRLTNWIKRRPNWLYGEIRF